MQFPTMDEDDVDFSVPGNSRTRLSSLFQNEGSSGDANQALKFTAPKQPKKNGNTQGAPGTLKLIHAVVVHTYKLQDGTYANQGKLGCAVLGHHETFTYKLLLYKGKQVQVTVVTITPSFNFHVQPNNYANFYDEKKENWSINFDSEAALFDFTKQVTLAKANSQGKSVTSLVIQDLVKGEGHSLENGDVAEVKYTGWLLTNFSFGQVFDSNMNSESLFRARLGKGKIIKGWNDGLIGMQKSGKRLLIIPSDLAYGSEGIGNTVPPNSTLIFEVHVVKIKVGRESSHSPSPIKISENLVDKKPDVPPRHSFSHEDNIRMRGASISEQLTQSPKRDKAQLISRMAKMGTATLPLQGAVPVLVSSDSESETEPPQPSSPAPQNISRTSSPKAFSKPRSRTDSGPVNVSTPPLQQQLPSGAMTFQTSPPPNQMSLYAQSVMSTQPFVCAATPFPAYQQTPMGSQFSIPQSPYSVPNVSGFMPPVSTSMTDSHLSLLISETRNQNTEIRMSLSKITDKVDTVIQKVDDVRLQGKSPNANIPFMEGAVILQNIERIIQENARLKEDSESKVSKIQSLNEIICDLFQRNPRFTEESNNLLEQKKEILQTASDQFQEKITNLEEEKSKFQVELSAASGKIIELEEKVTKYETLKNELNEKLEAAEKEARMQSDLINNTKEKLNEDEAQISSLHEKLKTAEHEKELLNMKLKSIEEEHTKAQGSSDLIEIYKNEIQEYKEKIEQLNSVINESISLIKFEEEKQKFQEELNINIKAKEEMGTKVKEMEKKIESYENLKLSYEDKIRRYEVDVQNLQTLKRKYEIFQEKTRALKETYENQIVELMNEIRHLQNTKSGTSPEFAVEIKKVMNRLYKVLQGKFQPDTSYSGSKVLETILQSIMALTLQILESKDQSSGDHANTSKLSGNEISSAEEMHSSSESQGAEFNQQNGLEEIKTEVKAVSEEPLIHSISSESEMPKKDAEDQPKSLDIPKETETSEVETKSESPINKKAAAMSDESNIKKVELVDRESPKSNMHHPSSNIFSELLSGTEGTKSWMQPPPLFDDDDDDDDDDDWFK